MKETAEEESCPLCYETFLAHDDDDLPLPRVTCSANNGCGTFFMCRLCVYRQAMQLERPFVIDDDTGDFVTLDPTACPQCKRPGAFREDMLPPLPEEIRMDVEAEVRQRRVDAAQRQRERAIRALGDAPKAKLEILWHETTGNPDEVIDHTHHPRVRIINGDRHPSKFRIDSYPCFDMGEMFVSEGNTTVGVPDLLSETSGMIYYEVEIKGGPQPPHLRHIFHQSLQFGFALANGMKVTDGYSNIGVGDNVKSWGFDGFTGSKIHVGRFSDDCYLMSRWEPGKVIGIAANLDSGMIALSVNGDWNYRNGNGVKFEDDSIKAGVYPCISCNQSALECRFGPDFKHAKPPESLWEIWPQYDDLAWIGISEEARDAALVLGYTKNLWDGNGDNPTEGKNWDDLTIEEKAAANTLGYNSDIWTQLSILWKIQTLHAVNDDSDGSDSSFRDDYDSSSDEESDSPFLSMRWSDLPGDARRAAGTLEYTQLTWNTNLHGPLDDTMWDHLTSEQQRAATVLGYDEEGWNEESDGSSSGDSSISTNTDDGLLPFEHMQWNDLPDNARDAAEKLGHIAESWDEDIKGPWDNDPWEELPTEQQTAAVVLGYNESRWNNSIGLIEEYDLASNWFPGRPPQG